METYKRFKSDLLGVLICWFFYACFLNWSDYGRDSTDSEHERSGVSLRTDYSTGCEYLEGRQGGLTPRLTSNGTHRGCK